MFFADRIPSMYEVLYNIAVEWILKTIFNEKTYLTTDRYVITSCIITFIITLRIIYETFCYMYEWILRCYDYVCNRSVAFEGR